MPADALSNYGEQYLRFVHQQGYPAKEDRRRDNMSFYKSLGSQAARKYCVSMVMAFHQALKNGTMPAWVKRQPSLHGMYVDVMADYHQKYVSTLSQCLPAGNQQAKIQPPIDLLQLSDDPVFLDQEMYKKDWQREETTLEKNTTVTEDHTEQEKEFLEGGNDQEVVILEAERRPIEVIDLLGEETELPLPKEEERRLRKKIRRLEREVQEREAIIAEWKRKFDQTQQKVILLETQLQEEKQENSELKNILICDKERIVQLIQLDHS